jgi:carbonic anhydrase
MLHRRGFLSGLLSCPICAQAARAEGAAHWEYDGAKGAQKWGELDPAFKTCAVGSEQSPIDLDGAIAAKTDHLALDWKPQAFEIVNNGHTIQANVAPGSGIQLGKEKYELKQFHFHTPSEHALGGARMAMEVHFVHAQPSGRLAVVGAFLTDGGSNTALSQILSVAPAHHGEARLDQPVDPRSLVPTLGALYRYEGSLTTPPCSEVVDWNIFGAPVAVAQADIDAFRKIFPNNARPLQPVNRRFVLQGN